MSVKILGGVARGYPLATPKSDLTKPTSIMIRRKLFDWRQNLEGHIFIDLFAGSGSMGLEALSRGATKVYLNDSQKIAFLTLKQNTEKFMKAFKLDPSTAQVSGLDAIKWVKKELPYQLSEAAEHVIIYLDPPYEDHALYMDVLNELRELKFDGEIWLESDRLVGPKLQVLTQAFSSVTKTIEQGDHFVLVGKLL
ncbi:MAG TPA: RsmD family RNA methyltransferase [Bacteriovoracaceae bacterium]|nr:RsmD family RNA methyltransferase [Bacteriovoracaceae bacterium]